MCGLTLAVKLVSCALWLRRRRNEATGTGLSADLGEVHPPSMVKPVVEVEVVTVVVVEGLAVVGAPHPTSKGASG